MNTVRHVLCLALLSLLLLVPRAPAAAQGCNMLFCSPSLTALPSVAVVDFYNPARVRRLPNGPVVELKRRAHFAAILEVAIPSTLPRTSFFVDTIWFPFASDDTNTFTGYTAADIEDADEVGANLPVFEVGSSFAVVKPQATNGWLGLSLGVVDQIGPASEPDDAREYTHRLQLELNTTIGVFNWLPKDNWFRNVEAYASLDYQATGLPNEGDEVPKNQRVFLEGASPWSVWGGLIIPIAPIAP